jgi:transcriptional regulator with XRE-family HTH domain
MKTINGLRIRHLLLDRDMRLKELAGALGIHHRTLHNWMEGETSPSVDQLISLAKILGVELNDLITEEGKDE